MDYIQSHMSQDWLVLTRMTGGATIAIERVRMVDTEVRIDGDFELPPLAQLAAEDQVFVAAFVRSHGSIKEMEQTFGVSYPTIKNRLHRIASQLPFAEVDTTPPSSASELLSQLERGELTARDVVARLKRPDHDRTRK
jgi:hypothetical protein